MILGIYLTTILASLGIDITMIVAANRRLKREGYKFKKVKRSFAENLLILIEFIISEVLPVINIAKTLIMLYKREELYYHLKNELLADEEIYFEAKTEIEEMEEKNKETNEFINYIPSKDNYKTYSEMTPQERLKVLEQEKASLLEQIEIEQEKVKTKGSKKIIS